MHDVAPQLCRMEAMQRSQKAPSTHSGEWGMGNTKGLQRISLDDQGEAVAVAVVVGTVFSGAGTVFSGARTGFSTVTVRAGGTGGAASSRLPALIRPRRNPTSSPKSSPTANVANHIRTALSSLTVVLPGLALLLLLPIVLSVHPCLNHTCPAP
jgi:hypothetical protein